MATRELVIREQSGFTGLGVPGAWSMEYGSETRYVNSDKGRIAYYTDISGDMKHKDILVAGFVRSEPHMNNGGLRVLDIETIDNLEVGRRVGRALMLAEMCDRGFFWVGEQGIADIAS
jgi:hypothetical protein